MYMYLMYPLKPNTPPMYVNINPAPQTPDFLLRMFSLNLETVIILLYTHTTDTNHASTAVQGVSFI